MEYVYIHTNIDYQERVKELEQYYRLALDTETYVIEKYKEQGLGTALDPHCSRISLLILMGDAGVPYLFDLILLEKDGYDSAPLLELLDTREYLIAHNGQFDIKMVKSHFGLLLFNVHCTRYLAKLLGNATGSKVSKAMGFSLEDLCRNLLNVHLTGKGKEQISDWGIRPDVNVPHQLDVWVKKLSYGAGDVKYLFTLHDMLWEVLTNPMPKSPLYLEGSETPPFGLGMAKSVAIEMGMATVAAEIEFNGLPASAELLSDIQLGLKNPETESGRIYEVAAELCEAFGLETYNSLWSDDGHKVPTDGALKILNSPAKLKRLLGELTGMKKIDNVQAVFLDRTLELLSQLSIAENENSEGAQLGYISEEEENIYKELENLERSEAAEKYKTLKLLVEYKRLSKQYSMDLSRHVNPVTGRIHSSMDMLGAATGRSSCIAEGTYISVPLFTTTGGLLLSYRRIEELKEGDSVLTFNPEPPHEQVIKKVKWAGLTGKNKEVCRVYWRCTDGSGITGELDLTPEHCLLTWRLQEGVGYTEAIWTEACCLNPGDSVLSYDPNLLTKEGYKVGCREVVKVRPLHRRVNVYDIEVEDVHCFIANELLAHNSARPNQQNISGRTKITVTRPRNNLFPTSSKIQTLHRECCYDQP